MHSPDVRGMWTGVRWELVLCALPPESAVRSGAFRNPIGRVGALFLNLIIDHGFATAADPDLLLRSVG